MTGFFPLIIRKECYHTYIIFVIATANLGIYVIAKITTIGSPIFFEDFIRGILINNLIIFQYGFYSTQNENPNIFYRASRLSENNLFTTYLVEKSYYLGQFQSYISIGHL